MNTSSKKFTVDPKFEEYFNGRIKQVFLYVTDDCNLDCVQCLYKPWLRKVGEIPEETALIMLVKFREMGAIKLSLIGGEPTLYGCRDNYKQLLSIIKRARDLGYKYIRLDTNGLFNTRLLEKEEFKLLDEITFSIDSHVCELNDALRGENSFGRSLANLIRAVDLGYRVDVTCCVHRKNVRRDQNDNLLIELMIRFAETIRVNRINFHPLFRMDIPRDEKGGHAIVPYKYEEESSGNKAYVYVYDSNYPGDNNRIVEFDLEEDKWKYKFQKGFWILGETWSGDSSIPELSIATMPLDIRLHKGIPPWGQDVPPYSYICSVGETTAPLFTNQNGEGIGFAEGEFIDEILEALYFIGPTQNQDKNSGLYYLPQEDDYAITFYGTDNGELDFSAYGSQLLVKLTGANVSPTTIDNINIGKGNSSLTYTTNDDYKEYSVTIAEELPDASRIVAVDTNISVGDTSTIEITDDQSLKYINIGGTKNYGFILEQRGKGAGQISFSGINIESNDTHIIVVSDWSDIDNAEIILEIDEDSDRVIDKEKTLQIVFEDPKRGTKLTIDTIDETFQFAAPDKEFPIKKADKMEIINPLSERENILIKYRDEDINFTAIAITGDTDFCSANLIDVKEKNNYLLIDKIGKE